MATLNALALDLIKEQGESSDDSNYIEVVEQWINDAYDEIIAAHNWRFLRSTSSLATVASTATYDISSDVRLVLGIRDTDNDEYLEFVDQPRIAWRNRDIEQTGTPRFWWYDSTQLDADNQQEWIIRLYPVPDAIYNLELTTYNHPDYVLTANHLPVFKEIILILKNRVRAYMLADDKDYDGSDRYLQLFMQGLDRLIQKENKNPAAKRKLSVRDISGVAARNHLAGLDPNHFR